MKLKIGQAIYIIMFFIIIMIVYIYDARNHRSQVKNYFQQLFYTRVSGPTVGEDGFAAIVGLDLLTLYFVVLGITNNFCLLPPIGKGCVSLGRLSIQNTYSNASLLSIFRKLIYFGDYPRIYDAKDLKQVCHFFGYLLYSGIYYIDFRMSFEF